MFHPALAFVIECADWFRHTILPSPDVSTLCTNSKHHFPGAHAEACRKKLAQRREVSLNAMGINAAVVFFKPSCQRSKGGYRSKKASRNWPSEGIFSAFWHAVTCVLLADRILTRE